MSVRYIIKGYNHNKNLLLSPTLGELVPETDRLWSHDAVPPVLRRKKRNFLSCVCYNV